MRIVVIGGSGHVGTYLVPRLVWAEHEVINVSRAQREPYRADSAWRLVQQVTADRTAEDAAGAFGRRILELKPDVVIDLICFHSAKRAATRWCSPRASAALLALRNDLGPWTQC